MELGLAGNVAVVTGASEGIGLETARMLAGDGVTVVSSSRSDKGPGELHVPADLSRPGEPERVVATARRTSALSWMRTSTRSGGATSTFGRAASRTNARFRSLPDTKAKRSVLVIAQTS